MLVLRRRDCQGLDPRVVAQMVEPSFAERDLLVIIDTVDDAAPLKPAHVAPDLPPQDAVSLSGAEDSRSVDAPDVQALIASAKYGKPVPSALQVAEQMALGVHVPDDVAEVATDLGVVVVPSHRGIECRRNDKLEFSTASMDAMFTLLLQLRRAEMERLLG